MREGEINVIDIDHHRNGVSGMPFYVLVFEDWEDRKMLGVVFPDEYGNFSVPDKFRNPYTAVFDMNMLAEDNIRFGENSWRGDHYDRALRDAIVAREPDDPDALEMRVTGRR